MKKTFHRQIHDCSVRGGRKSVLWSVPSITVPPMNSPTLLRITGDLKIGDKEEEHVHQLDLHILSALVPRVIRRFNQVKVSALTALLAPMLPIEVFHVLGEL